MGWTSKKKKKVFVDTQTINLAGEEDDRPHFLKTVIVDQTLHNTYSSYTESIQQNIMKGPAIKLRSFARWAESTDMYKKIGMNKQSIIVGSALDINILLSAIQELESNEVVLINGSIENPTVDYWVDRYILNNMPERIEDEYFSQVDESNSNQAIFYFTDDDLKPISPTYTVDISDYVEGDPYIFATYYTKKGSETGSTVSTGFIEVSEFTDVSNWDKDDNEFREKVDHTYPENTKVTRIHNSGEEEIIRDQTKLITESKEEVGSIYHLVTRLPITEGDIDPRERVQKLWQVKGYVLKPSYTKTEKVYEGYKDITEVFSYELVLTKKEKTDTRIDYIEVMYPTQSLIYRKGSGNKILDSVFESEKDAGTYYPYFPLILNKRAMDSPNSPGKGRPSFDVEAAWKATKDGFKKATGSKNLPSILSDLKKSEGSQHIDFAIIMLGATINTKEQAAKKYIYSFFNGVQGNIKPGETTIKELLREIELYVESADRHTEWVNAQRDSSNPLFGTEEPNVLPEPVIPTQGFSIGSGSAQWKLSWNYMEKDILSSNVDSEHLNIGEIGIYKGKAVNIDADRTLVIKNREPGKKSFKRIRRSVDLSSIYIVRRLNDKEWERITVHGLALENHIYDGQSHRTNAYNEIGKKGTSSIIIPLNTALYRNMSLINGTQMTTSNLFLIINSYQVHKYKVSRFKSLKIVGFVLVIAVGVFTGGAGFAAGAGLLGSNIAVGTAIGLTGMAAVVVGAVANAVAAIIVTNIITKAASSLLGNALGNIIGLVASIIAVAYLSGSTLTESLSEVFNPKNLLKITESAINSVGEMGMMAAQQIMGETQKLIEAREKEAEELKDLLASGEYSSYGLLDPMKYTQMAKELRIEQPDVFFNRTLLTGMDIADLSMESISMFTDLALEMNLKI